VKNVTFYTAVTVGGVTWFLIVWALVVVANRSNVPEPSTDEEVKRAVVLAIMTKRNSRNPTAFMIEKVAVVGNTICMTYSGQNAFGEHTGEQVLMEKNSNQPWYSAQEGFIDRWVKFCARKGDDITDVVMTNLPTFEAALKTVQSR
jgi:hypothetical protein